MRLLKSSCFSRRCLFFVCCSVSLFDQGTVSPSRPRYLGAPGAAVVKADRRSPPEAARIAALTTASTARSCLGREKPIGSEGELAGRGGAFEASAATLYSVRPICGSQTMMQSCASTAKLRRAGPFYKSGTRSMGGCGTPPPRIVISNASPERGGNAAEIGYLLACLLWLLVSLNRRPAPGATSCPPAPCRC